MNNKIRSETIFLLIIGLIGCKFQNYSEKTGKFGQRNLETFDEFYKKFHSDSSFQMSRIEFPLKGEKRDGSIHPDSIRSNFYWNDKDWIIHKDVDYKSLGYKEEIDHNDSIYIQKIFIENSGIQIERHFKLIDCSWYLYYYSDIIM